MATPTNGRNVASVSPQWFRNEVIVGVPSS
jgi:hypothetical protein